MTKPITLKTSRGSTKDWQADLALTKAKDADIPFLLTQALESLIELSDRGQSGVIDGICNDTVPAYKGIHAALRLCRTCLNEIQQTADEQLVNEVEYLRAKLAQIEGAKIL